jgi:hypothetical protein
MTTKALRLMFVAALLPIGVAAMAQTAAKPKSDMDKVVDTGQNIVEKPLKDLNITQDKIPPQLLAIMDAPYNIKGITSCAQIADAIAKLDAVLGPDVDSKAATAAKNESATEFALSGAQSLAGGLIPGTGLIRKVSGAEAAQKKAAAAVLAGSLRRGFLKGTGRAKGCKV